MPVPSIMIEPGSGTVLSNLPEALVTSAGVPVNVAGIYNVGTAAFGPALTVTGVTSDLMPVTD